MLNLLFILMLSIGQSISLDSLEQRYISQALDSLNLTITDLGFDKKLTEETPFRLKTVEAYMDEPLKLPNYADATAKMLSNPENDLIKIITAQARALGVAITEKDIQTIRKDLFSCLQPINLTGFLPNKICLALSYLEISFDFAQYYLDQATQSLTPKERAALSLNTVLAWINTKYSDSLLKSIPIQADTIRTDSLIILMKKVDLRNIILASLTVVEGMGLAYRELAELKKEDSKLNQFEFPGRHGKIAIGGYENNVFLDDYAIIIDLGGNDVYRGRFAAGFGKTPLSVVIDLGGNDLYSSEKVLNAGTGVMGVGILWDLGGDDIYQNSHIAQAAGIFGLGVIIDESGQDIYQSGFFSQGAGCFGLGILIDKTGNDSYRGYGYNQAVGGPMGYGILADYNGNDSYFSGGQTLHKPLLPKDYQSLSQGFGYGWRDECGGGIGFLYDAAGNDNYVADVYGQGASYWYALGVLYDKKGNDHYLATEYAQGAGIHLSLGCLIDQAGDDQYYSRFGPGQGEGHDYSVGILIDKKGNDAYQISGGQGIGLSNSVGIFIDSKGNDTYLTTEKLGQGNANPSRGFGGIGIFLDLAGKDIYPSDRTLTNDTTWKQGLTGIGIDVNSSQTSDPDEEKIEMDKSTLTPSSSIKEIFADASLWEVGSAKEKVRIARKMLIERKEETIKYIWAEKIATKEGLELRAIMEVADSLPELIKPYILKSLTDSRQQVRFNSLYLVIQLKIKEAQPTVLEMLKTEKKKSLVLATLGEIGDTSATLQILSYLKYKNETYRRIAAIALGNIADTRAASDLINALADKYFSVRLASQDALIKLGQPVQPLVEKALKNCQSKIVRYHLEEILKKNKGSR